MLVEEAWLAVPLATRAPSRLAVGPALALAALLVCGGVAAWRASHRFIAGPLLDARERHVERTLQDIRRRAEYLLAAGDACLCAREEPDDSSAAARCRGLLAFARLTWSPPRSSCDDEDLL